MADATHKGLMRILRCYLPLIISGEDGETLKTLPELGLSANRPAGTRTETEANTLRTRVEKRRMYVNRMERVG